MNIPAETLGERIRRLRQATPLSLRAMGQKVGCQATTLMAIEKGKANPHLETLRDISDALGVELWELMQGVRWPDRQHKEKAALPRSGRWVVRQGEVDCTIESSVTTVTPTTESAPWQRL